MRRLLAIALIAAQPAQAWEFTPGLPCLLTHSTDQGIIELTHDPRGPHYTITLTRPDPWMANPTFAIRFDGDNPNTIVTDRHVLSDDGLSLTVADTGFGNVLDGIVFNTTATATTGQSRFAFPLDGADGPVEAFRACAERPAA